MVAGLRNVNANCYFNAAVQCCLFVPPICNYYLGGSDRSDDGRVASLFGELVEAAWKDADDPARAFDSEGLRSAAGISAGGGRVMGDSHEAFVGLLNALSSSVKGYRSVYAASRPDADRAWKAASEKPPSIVDETFRGILRREFTCAACGAKKHDDACEAFLDVPVALGGGDADAASVTALLATALGRSEAESSAECGACGEKGNVVVACSVDRHPRVLAITAVRFDGDGRKVFRPFVGETIECDFAGKAYRLIAFALHLGAIAGSGHYVAVGCTRGEWFLVDDDRCLRIEKTKAAALAASAYYSLYISRDD